MLEFMFPPSLGRLAASARAELMAQWFLRHLNTELTITVAPDYETLRRAILAGDIDLAWAPPYLCAAVQRSSLAILKSIRGGRSTYRSALIVRANEATTLAQLRGARASWVDRLSTGGYLLPIAHLRRLGYDPDELLDSQVFSGSYGDAIRGLLDRTSDLSAIYTHDPSPQTVTRSLHELVGPDAAGLQVLDFTQESPADGLVVVDRPETPNSQQVLQQISQLTDGHQNTLLLTIFDADALERARVGEYDALLDPRG